MDSQLAVQACYDTKALSAPAYLLVFDHRPEAKGLSWDDRISWEKEGDITALGC